MEKEFVPYVLAVKLKSLGFDEECFGFYNPTVTEKVIMNNDSYGGYGLSYEHIVVAPTFSQAFRWFREKYRLLHDITLTTNVDDKLVGFYMLIHKMNDDLVVDEEDDDVEVEVMTTDKDEAELACLEKLIEIVESKSE